MLFLLQDSKGGRERNMLGEVSGQRRHHTKALHTRRHVYTSELQCNIKCRQTTTNERDQAADAFLFPPPRYTFDGLPFHIKACSFSKSMFFERKDTLSHFLPPSFMCTLSANVFTVKWWLKAPVHLRMYMCLLFMFHSFFFFSLS